MKINAKSKPEIISGSKSTFKCVLFISWGLAVLWGRSGWSWGSGTGTHQLRAEEHWRNRHPESHQILVWCRALSLFFNLLGLKSSSEAQRSQPVMLLLLLFLCWMLTKGEMYITSSPHWEEKWKDKRECKEITERIRVWWMLSSVKGWTENRHTHPWCLPLRGSLQLMYSILAVWGE